MEPNNNQPIVVSEVARMRAQIELECQALSLVFNAPATVASHDFINSKYKALDASTQELEKLIGKQEAAKIVYEIYDKEVK